MRSRALHFLALIAMVLGSPDWARAGVKVEIEGFEGDLEKNAAAMVTLSRAQDDWTEGQIKRQHRRAPEEIQRALQPFGYYQATVEASLEPDGENWIARYRVTSGPVAVVDQVDIQLTGEGSADTPFVAIAQRFPVHPGTPLDHVAYEIGKKNLMRYAATKGYFEAVFDTSAILVDVAAAQADVIVHFDTGTRFAFGEARLNQDVLDPNRLQGYVNFEPGDWAVQTETGRTVGANLFYSLEHGKGGDAKRPPSEEGVDSASRDRAKKSP